jgi:hypothetical protein
MYRLLFSTFNEKKEPDFEMKVTYWTRHWLLLTIFAIATGIYVDEPLLYDNFPSDFMWAAATSAYQIEGGWNADGKNSKCY